MNESSLVRQFHGKIENQCERVSKLLSASEGIPEMEHDIDVLKRLHVVLRKACAAKDLETLEHALEQAADIEG